MQRIATQMNALKQGFQEILPLETLKVFDEKEVEVRHDSFLSLSLTSISYLLLLLRLASH